MSRPIVAVVWTWKKHSVCKTKKRAHEKMRAWRKWYERQGWTVRGNATTGYIAYHDDHERHACTIHHYDPLTRERLDYAG